MKNKEAICEVITSICKLKEMMDFVKYLNKSKYPSYNLQIIAKEAYKVKDK